MSTKSSQTRRERKHFMSSKISKVRKFGDLPKQSTKKRSHDQISKETSKTNNTSADNTNKDLSTNSQEYKDFMRLATLETLELGVEKMKGRDKLLEENRLRRLQGGTLKKAAKMPLPILLAQQKKHASDDVKKRKFLQEIGAYVPKYNNKKTKPSESVEDFLRAKIFDQTGLGSLGTSKRGLKTSIGRFSNGTLSVSTRDIERVKTSQHHSSAAPKRGRGIIGNRTSSGKKLSKRVRSSKSKRRR
mmetsp:Transcript_23100/g.39270  ORF Transcript_23100/g.39270 Transcript_23100/m.39270 type:complete len:245 (-) Transcript_23100:29-763(-)